MRKEQDMGGKRYPPKEQIEALQKFVLGRIYSLQREYLGKSGSGAHARAVLARLRRGSMTNTPAWTQVDDDFFEKWPVIVLGEPEDNTKAVNAVDGALRIFALHQQSQHVYGVAGDVDGDEKGSRPLPFGRACKLISQGDNTTKNVRLRMEQVRQALDFETAIRKMLLLVRLMKSSRVHITIDYGRLVSDLYRIQYPAVAQDVFNEWGLQYFHSAKSDSEQ